MERHLVNFVHRVAQTPFRVRWTPGLPPRTRGIGSPEGHATSEQLVEEG